jgi:hypothetical protein
MPLITTMIVVTTEIHKEDLLIVHRAAGTKMKTRAGDMKTMMMIEMSGIVIQATKKILTKTLTMMKIMITMCREVMKMITKIPTTKAVVTATRDKDATHAVASVV